MYTVELYARIRRECLVEGKSMRQAARDYGIHRHTIKKMLEHPMPPGYRQSKPLSKPKVDKVIDKIHQVLEGDKTVHRKQRHTIKRLFVRMRDEEGYEGSYNTLRHYVNEYRQTQKEVFCPLFHEPGNAQADFGKGLFILRGEKTSCHLFVINLPHSDTCFIKAYARENTEAFCEGHVSAFAFFGGVPLNVLYDNTSIAVSFVAGQRQKTKAFRTLQSHYLFQSTFARICKGNDKGKVENLVGYMRRNFMVPLPRFDSFEELNKYLESCCLERQKDVLLGHKASIGERFARDKDVFLPLPQNPYESCVRVSGRVNSESLVSFKGNKYSVPVRYAHQDVWIKSFVTEVIISYKTTVIAHHTRCYGQAEYIFNPLHYLPLLEKKTGDLDQAAPLKGWALPAVFEKLKSLLEKRDGKPGKRTYVKVLRLLETFELKHVEGGVKDALKLGAISDQAIKHLTLCRLENRPPQLNMMNHPNLPQIPVKTTKSQDYKQLLEQTC